MAGSGQPSGSLTRVRGQMAGFCRAVQGLVETAICAAAPGRWPLKPMPAVGRSVAVARASAERRGGPLAGRAGRAATVRDGGRMPPGGAAGGARSSTRP